jgi:hypothetical protein
MDDELRAGLRQYAADEGITLDEARQHAVDADEDLNLPLWLASKIPGYMDRQANRERWDEKVLRAEAWRLLAQALEDLTT